MDWNGWESTKDWWKNTHVRIRMGIIFLSISIIPTIAALCYIFGSINGQYEGYQKGVRSSYYSYMLRSTYGTHTIGVQGDTAEEAKELLDKMIEISEKYKWSVIGEPVAITSKSGDKIYMYQKIFKLYWGEDEKP